MLVILLALALVPAADPPAFVVESVRNERLAGDFVRINADGTAQVGDVAIPVGEFIALRRPGAPPARPNDRPHLLLGNGDRIPGRLLAIENDRAQVAADLGHEVPMVIPLTAISAIWMVPRAAGRLAGPGQFDASALRPKDVLRLTNGDAIPGTVVSVARNGPVRFETGESSSDIARDRIDAIIFSTELARPLRSKGPVGRLVTRNGGRIRLWKLSSDADSINGELLFGGALRIPWSEVAVLTIEGGAMRYLSDLKPIRYESTPFFGLSWPLAIDQSAVRGDLRLGGGTFDKGLGLHSACRATVAIPARSIRFAASVGLDDVTGRRGAANVRFLLDGQAIPDSRFELLGGQSPYEAVFALPSGARELTIVVEFGPGGDVQDHVNLGDARFILTP